jgi:peptidoglycan-associated lipoprotein
MKKILMALGVIAIMAGCSSTGPVQDVKVDDKSATTDTKGGTGTPVTGTTGGSGVTGKQNSGHAKAGILAQRSIYFDYDKDSVKPEFAAIVQAHATFLAANKGRKIRLEGHADERGSREYNMALGQRRANAVKKAANALGVSSDRIETISFGEDKPKANGHDEASWAQNRRVDIVYDGE